jgi:hypothetical protein
MSLLAPDLAADRFARARVAVVPPVPPFDTPRVPDIVMTPDVVIGPPEKMMPVEPPLTSIDVTVPKPAPLAAIVMPPEEFVMLMPEPAVSVESA